jgi:hypothetical protein
MKEAERKIAIVATIGILICMLIITFTNQAKAQVDPAKRYAKEWRSNSFESRMKSNKGFTMQGAKSGLKQAKKDRKQTAKRERYYSRVEAVRNKTARLK